MRATLILGLAAAVLLAVARADDPEAAQDGVLDLTPDTFDQHVGKDGVAALVEFYAPWCGHCKNLVPEYAKVGKAVKGKSNVVVAKVNADAHSSLGSKFGVSGFPTIKFFPAGSQTPEDYNGGRDAASFVTFLKEKTGDSSLFVPKEATSVTVLGASNFDKVCLDTNVHCLAEFYAPWCGHCKQLAPKYEIVARTFEGEPSIVVANVNADEASNKALASRYGVQGFPTIKWFPKNNKDGEEYNGGRDAESFISFINEKAGTNRVVGGDLNAAAGTDPKLNELAAAFLKDQSGKDALLAAVKAAGDEYAYYAKVAAKTGEKADFAAKEKARLDKMLGGSIKQDKRDGMVKRRNVLAAFLGETAAPAEAIPDDE